MSDIVQLFMIGVVSSYGACFISCWPIALPFVTATGKTWHARLNAALAFLSAKLVVYVLLGAAAATLGRTMTGWIVRSSSVLYIASGIGIILLGVRAVYTETHPCGTFLRRLRVRSKVASAALLGIFAGVLPCATSLVVMAYIAFSAQSPLTGATLGFAFGAGKFFSPLIPASLLANYLEGRLKLNRIWLRRICALLVIVLGVRLMLTGF